MATAETKIRKREDMRWNNEIFAAGFAQSRKEDFFTEDKHSQSTFGLEVGRLQQVGGEDQQATKIVSSDKFSHFNTRILHSDSEFDSLLLESNITAKLDSWKKYLNTLAQDDLAFSWRLFTAGPSKKDIGRKFFQNEHNKVKYSKGLKDKSSRTDVRQLDNSDTNSGKFIYSRLENASWRIWYENHYLNSCLKQNSTNTLAEDVEDLKFSGSNNRLRENMKKQRIVDYLKNQLGLSMNCFEWGSLAGDLIIIQSTNTYGTSYMNRYPKLKSSHSNGEINLPKVLGRPAEDITDSEDDLDSDIDSTMLSPTPSFIDFPECSSNSSSNDRNMVDETHMESHVDKKHTEAYECPQPFTSHHSYIKLPPTVSMLSKMLQVERKESHESKSAGAGYDGSRNTGKHDSFQLKDCPNVFYSGTCSSLPEKRCNYVNISGKLQGNLRRFSPSRHLLASRPHSSEIGTGAKAAHRQNFAPVLSGIPQSKVEEQCVTVKFRDSGCLCFDSSKSEISKIGNSILNVVSDSNSKEAERKTSNTVALKAFFDNSENKYKGQTTRETSNDSIYVPDNVIIW